MANGNSEVVAGGVAGAGGVGGGDGAAAPGVEAPKFKRPEAPKWIGEMIKENPKSLIFIALFALIWWATSGTPRQQHHASSAEAAPSGFEEER